MQLTQGTVAAITGAGSGIGRALALHLSVRGCALVLADINMTGLEETAILARKGQASQVSTHVVGYCQLKAFP